MPKVIKKKVAFKKAPIKKIIRSIITKKPVEKKKSNWLIVLGVANIVAFLAVVIINYLAVQLPIGGMTTGALADLYPNLFVPAGITFSIRGVIYLLVLGFVVRQIIDLFRKKSLGITKKVGIRFLLSCLTNIGRIFAWHNTLVFISMLLLIAFFVAILMVTKKVHIGEKFGTRKDKLLVQVPFSVYLGRLSVAAIANITARLVHIGWNMRGMTEIFRTSLVIIVATFVALKGLYKKNDILFAFVFVRAFIGIIMKRVAVDPIYTSSIIWLLGICTTIIAGGIGMNFTKRRKN